ncbi:Rhodanese-like protein [Clavulina sp. PMI_390]|nr:Rhodanese-like protein [Clavulina sp. PMI_390]
MASGTYDATTGLPNMVDPTFPRIKARELRDVIKNAKRMQDYVIVDVRDEDFEGGNIPGCIHLPSYTFDRDVDDLAQRVKKVKNVIFTCFYSQQRGPLAARKFRDIRDATVEMEFEQNIYVLGGGMSRFISYFGEDEKYIENYDPEFWSGVKREG